MESWGTAINPYPVDFCYWRDPDRIHREKDHELYRHPTRLVMGRDLYFARYHYLADGSIDGQYTLRAVYIFHALYKKDWR